MDGLVFHSFRRTAVGNKGEFLKLNRTFDRETHLRTGKLVDYDMLMTGEYRASFVGPTGRALATITGTHRNILV